jgi:hypothetical protein
MASLGWLVARDTIAGIRLDDDNDASLQDMVGR